MLLPFEPLVPNAETIAVMKKARSGGLSSFATVEELMASLDAGETNDTIGPRPIFGVGNPKNPYPKVKKTLGLRQKSTNASNPIVRIYDYHELSLCKTVSNIVIAQHNRANKPKCGSVGEKHQPPTRKIHH